MTIKGHTLAKLNNNGRQFSFRDTFGHACANSHHHHLAFGSTISISPKNTAKHPTWFKGRPADFLSLGLLDRIISISPKNAAEQPAYHKVRPLDFSSSLAYHPTSL